MTLDHARTSISGSSLGIISSIKFQSRKTGQKVSRLHKHTSRVIEGSCHVAPRLAEIQGYSIKWDVRKHKKKFEKNPEEST